MTDVLMNDFARQWAEVGEDVLKATRRVGASGWYILGQEVQLFEQELASFCGCAAAVGCASGLDAIEIALRALGLAPGQNVLTTPLSAFATTLAITRAGGVPVFVDVDETGGIDLDLAEQAFEADPDLRYFVPVHLYGNPFNLDRLSELKARFGLRIVEDCAQAIGASWRDKPVGSVGDLAALSFYPTKNLGAMGDGGAVLGSEMTLLARCRQLRDYGQSAKYQHELLGLNSRLDELQAAILRDAFLPRLDRWTKRRREIANLYRQALPGLVLPLSSLAHSVAHLFPIKLANRAVQMERLRALGIQTAIHYPSLIPDQPALADYRRSVIGELQQARRLASEELSLPLHPYLTDNEVGRVIESIQACVASSYR